MKLNIWKTFFFTFIFFNLGCTKPTPPGISGNTTQAKPTVQTQNVINNNANTPNSKNKSSSTTISVLGLSASNVPAPTYCVTSGYNSPCEISNFDNLAITFDGSPQGPFIVSEKINLYPTHSLESKLSLDKNEAVSTGQTAEYYKIIGLAPSAGALVNNGVYYTGATDVSNTGNCGVVSNISDNSGCIFSAVDTLWNNSSNASPKILSNVNTFGYGNFNPNSSNIPLSLSINLATAFTPTSPKNDFLGFFVPALGSCPQGGTYYNGSCAVLAKTNQASVRYLILRHEQNIDSSIIPSYFMLVFTAGF